jgi:hypothetical protein
MHERGAAGLRAEPRRDARDLGRPPSLPPSSRALAGGAETDFRIGSAPILVPPGLPTRGWWRWEGENAAAVAVARRSRRSTPRRSGFTNDRQARASTRGRGRGANLGGESVDSVLSSRRQNRPRGAGRSRRCFVPVVSRNGAPRNSARKRGAPRDKRPWPIAAPSARLATKPLVAAMAAMGNQFELPPEAHRRQHPRHRRRIVDRRQHPTGLRSTGGKPTPRPRSPAAATPPARAPPTASPPPNTMRNPQPRA